MKNSFKDGKTYAINVQNLGIRCIRLWASDGENIDVLKDSDLIASLIVYDRDREFYEDSHDFYVGSDSIIKDKKNNDYLLFKFNEKNHKLVELNTNIEFGLMSDVEEDDLSISANDSNSFMVEFEKAKKSPLVVYYSSDEVPVESESKEIQEASKKYIPYLQMVNEKGTSSLDRQFSKMVEAKHVIAKFEDYKKYEEAKKVFKN